MSRIQTRQNQVIIKGNVFFLIMSIVASFMAFSGLSMLFEIISFEEEFLPETVFGVIFMTVWCSIVVWMACYSLSNFTKRIIIDETGVTGTSIFGRKHYNWSDIADYGLSFSGKTRDGEGMYDLYFSKAPQQRLTNYKKRIKGSVIKTFIFNKESAAFCEIILPLCKRYCPVQPFVGIDNRRFS